MLGFEGGEPMTSLALRLYNHMTACPCHFQPACSSCQLDLRAIKSDPQAFNNLAEAERNFRSDARQIEAGTVKDKSCKCKNPTASLEDLTAEIMGIQQNLCRKCNGHINA